MNKETAPEATGKTVLIVGDFSLESVEDKIVTLGYTFQKRTLHSAPLDWLEMQKDLKQLITSEDLLAVLMFLSKETLFHTCSSEYMEAWRSLLVEMKTATSLIFVHKDNFQRIFLDGIPEIRISEARRLIQELLKYLEGHETDFIFILEKLKNICLSLFDISILIKKITWIEKSDHMISNLDRFNMNLLEYSNRINKNRDVENDMKYLNLDELLNYLRYSVPEIENILGQLEKDHLAFDGQLEGAAQLLQTLQISGLKLAPYRERKEISLRVHQFLDELDEGVFLHLYVPNGRYQEDQLASFLRLFESYLQQVENLQIFIDTRKTLHGQIYEFKSKNVSMNLTDIEVALSRFDQFMSLCQSDQKKAETLLLKMCMYPSEVSRLLTKYLKEYQRLLLDMEHERERKMLDLRQRLESEVLDLTSGTSPTITQPAQPSALFSLPHNVDPIGITISNSSVIINPGIQTYIEQAIYGDIHYNAEDKTLLDLFEKYTERLETVLLRSQLEQLKDASSPTVERETAKQKIVSFLSKVTPAISQSALTVLTAYLEKLLTGS